MLRSHTVDGVCRIFLFFLGLKSFYSTKSSRAKNISMEVTGTEKTTPPSHWGEELGQLFALQEALRVPAAVRLRMQRQKQRGAQMTSGV